ncbi:hypothetical protein BDZ89DRAFT_1112513 [Hymenopellis radicata]|nr:hypothetical protein BDZ89DRAFT_1112513 [Hymenopellis radicata]
MSGSDLMGLGLGAALVSVVALKSRSTSRLLLVVVLKIRVLYHHQDINAFGLILANRVSVSMVLTFKYRPHVDILFEFDEDEGLCSSLTLPSTSVTGTSSRVSLHAAVVFVACFVSDSASRCRIRASLWRDFEPRPTQHSTVPFAWIPFRTAERADVLENEAPWPYQLDSISDDGS